MAEEIKKKAVELLKALEIYKPYILDFFNRDKVCVFERYGGYYVDQKEFKEVEAKRKEIEAKYEITVYAITHEITDFGELYDFLYVPAEKEEWDYLLEQAEGLSYVQVYSWNKTDDFCSEFGSVGVRSFGGGIMRVA